MENGGNCYTGIFQERAESSYYCPPQKACDLTYTQLVIFVYLPQIRTRCVCILSVMVPTLVPLRQSACQLPGVVAAEGSDSCTVLFAQGHVLFPGQPWQL